MWKHVIAKEYLVIILRREFRMFLVPTKIEKRRNSLMKDFTKKLSTYNLLDASSSDCCMWSYHKTRVLVHAYFKNINTLFIMSDEETLESENIYDPYRLTIKNQVFDGYGTPTVVVFSKKEHDIIMDHIAETTKEGNPLLHLIEVNLQTSVPDPYRDLIGERILLRQITLREPIHQHLALIRQNDPVFFHTGILIFLQFSYRVMIPVAR